MCALGVFILARIAHDTRTCRANCSHICTNQIKQSTVTPFNGNQFWQRNLIPSIPVTKPGSQTQSLKDVLPTDSVDESLSGHTVQLNDAFAPLIIEKEPTSHFVQNDAAIVSEKEPSSHCRHP